MKRIFQTIALLLPVALLAQTKAAKPTTHTADTGIHFQHGLSWQQTLAKAKAEHKYIFVDGFTTWCGPCRYMSKNVFPQKAVGDAMNPKFIAVKFQLDTTDADNDEVKKLYADAHSIAVDYNIRAYPTYLFFSPDGKLVHRALGSSEADAFLAKVNDATNPQTQYYTQLALYKEGRKDSAFLHRLTTASMEAYDEDNSRLIAADYLATQPNLFTKDNLQILQSITQKSSDRGFGIMMDSAAQVDAVLGKGTADGLVQNIIMREEVYPVMFPKRVASPKDLEEPDWSVIDKNLQDKYPARAAAISDYSKAIFYMNKGDYDKFGPAIVTYMKSHGETLSDEQLNEFAWTVFQHCSDETCLQNAMEWSRRSFERSGTPGFMDTYANILYRLGRKDEALEWEGKAKEAAPEGDKAGYQQVIDKIKAGEKTWN